MFDRIKLGSSQNSVIRKDIPRIQVRNGKPSPNYCRPFEVLIDERRLTIAEKRQDSSARAAKYPFMVSFNGFDIGSYQHSRRLLESILEKGDADQFYVTELETCIDLLATPSFVERNILDLPVDLFQSWSSIGVMHEKMSRGAATICLGSKDNRQLKIYDKKAQLTHQFGKRNIRFPIIEPITRIENRYGSRYFARHPLIWRDIYSRLNIFAEEFSKIKLLDNKVSPPMFEKFSIEGLVILGFNFLSQRGDFSPIELLGRFKSRPDFERLHLKVLLNAYMATKRGGEVSIGSLAEMFIESAHRFFHQINSDPLPSIIWEIDGTRRSEIFLRKLWF